METDGAACDRLALRLRSVGVPQAREEINLDSFNSVERAQLLFFVVAICHQTSVHGRPALEGIVEGQLVRGWDYLLQKFTEVVRSDRAKLDSGYWAGISAEDLRLIFRNSRGQDLLERLEGRAALIRDAGQLMNLKGWQNLQQIYAECDGRISTGSPNLLETLSAFAAYRDPVRKKSFFLLSLLQNSGTWKYRDPEHLGAPVDYHEVRGHLRLGTVVVRDSALRSKLMNRQPVTASEDIAIRTAVLGAIMRLSQSTGSFDPERLHYMFWNIFRNYCTREAPNCHGHRTETYLPERYATLSRASGNEHACPFSHVCVSAGLEERYLEHVFDTDFY